MALHLKRITDPYFCCHCDITRKLITYGDYYYEDDEDGFIVDYNYYYDRKMANKIDQALQNPEINYAMDSMSYKTMMRQKEREMFDKTLFNRKLATDIAFKDDEEDKGDRKKDAK